MTIFLYIYPTDSIVDEEVHSDYDHNGKKGRCRGHIEKTRRDASCNPDGVLIEVPVMLMLVSISKRTCHIFGECHLDLPQCKPERESLEVVFE